MLFGALGTRDLLLDRGEPFGVLPGTAQSFCHQERDEPQDGGPLLAKFVEAGAQQPQSGDDIAALDDEHSLKVAATGASLGQLLPRPIPERLPSCPARPAQSRLADAPSEGLSKRQRSQETTSGERPLGYILLSVRFDWPGGRDARLYSGPSPVVCHSPCERSLGAQWMVWRVSALSL
jgi:hypothetical protein